MVSIKLAALLTVLATASVSVATRVHVRIGPSNVTNTGATTTAPSDPTTPVGSVPLLEIGRWEPIDAAKYKLVDCKAQSWTLTRKGVASLALRFSSVNISPDDQLIVSAVDGSSPQQVRSESLTTLPIRGTALKLEFRPSTKGCAAAGKAPSFAIDALGFEWPANKIITKESVCGKNTAKDAQCFKDEYPKEYAASRAVARTVFINASKDFVCTAWLWGNQGHLVSNHHCFSSQKVVDTARFEFLFEAPQCNNSCVRNACPIAEMLVAKNNVKFIKSNPALDYAVLQITTNAKHYVEKYGYLRLRDGAPHLGEKIYIPQHPGGKPKKIALTDDDNDSQAASLTRLNQWAFSGDVTLSGLVGYAADTEGGSSGSPVILRSSHLVVALHHHGGCANKGTPSSLLLKPFRDISSTNDGVAKEGVDVAATKDDNADGDDTDIDTSDDDDEY
ncbi:hypothetical protein PybrP1_005081 [[Pythium] brassicae (nom. inval.)]|nr:hypothetical protein PybrP1_005081 [[Pythium] brassicae (nom. inval.)]